MTKLDLVLMNPMADPGHLAALKEMKKEGRVRYIGDAGDRRPPVPPALEAVMRNEPIDFIGVDYSIDNRGVEQTILPLAQERKIGVVAYFPFDARQPLPARRHHAASGLGRRVRRQDVGAVLRQVRHQPPGRHRGPRGDEQAEAHAREHRRRQRPPAESRRRASAWRS